MLLPASLLEKLLIISACKKVQKYVRIVTWF